VINEYATVSGMKTDRRKHAPVPFYFHPICPDLGLNLGCRGGKPATNGLSYGVAVLYVLTVSWRQMWLRAKCKKHFPECMCVYIYIYIHTDTRNSTMEDESQ
jgi:hypothetical protein